MAFRTGCSMDWSVCGRMAGIDTPANCGPLLKDAYLLERIGFTAERIAGRVEKDQTVIDPESLLNHLRRFTEQDLEAGFLQHLEVIRHKRWLRAGCMRWMDMTSSFPMGKDTRERAASVT